MCHLSLNFHLTAFSTSFHTSTLLICAGKGSVSNVRGYSIEHNKGVGGAGRRVRHHLAVERLNNLSLVLTNNGDRSRDGDRDESLKFRTNPVKCRQNIREWKGLFSSVPSLFHMVCIGFCAFVSISTCVSVASVNQALPFNIPFWTALTCLWEFLVVGASRVILSSSFIKV